MTMTAAEGSRMTSGRRRSPLPASATLIGRAVSTEGDRTLARPAPCGVQNVRDAGGSLLAPPSSAALFLFANRCNILFYLQKINVKILLTWDSLQI